MKKTIITLITLLLLAPLGAKDLKVLLDSRRQIETITFLENYAIVINKDHYYGPISKDNRLKIEIFDPSNTTNGKIRLWLEYKETVKDKNGKSTEEIKYQDLGRTSSRIDIVRGLDDGTDFSKTINASQKQTSKSIDPKYVNLSKQAKKTTPFFRYKNSELSDWIEFTGPLSLFVRGKPQNSFYMVETIPLENYLVHVTNCEIRTAHNVEAYKAQSILARTYALQKTQERLKLTTDKKEDWSSYQLYPDERDQAYICELRVKNDTPPSEGVKKAVKETEGKVLGQNNKLIKVNYCAFCGDCSYCKRNHCEKTKNGLGVCQHGLADYAKNKYDYTKILHHFYPDAKIYIYGKDGSLAYSSEAAQEELENSLNQAEERLKHLI